MPFSQSKSAALIASPKRLFNGKQKEREGKARANHKAILPKETCGMGEEHLDSELGVRNITTQPFFLGTDTHVLFYF